MPPSCHAPPQPGSEKQTESGAGRDREEGGEEKTGFWQRRLIQPIRTQLTQGATPRALSFAVAAGILCGLFPILGTTTIITTVVAFVFRLNQPVMQSINWFIYPLQLALIPVYIRGGEFLFGAAPIPFSIPQMLEIFAESPGGFLADFWITMVHCIVAWLVTAPLLGGVIVLAVRPALDSAARRWKAAKSSSPSPSS